MTALPRTSRAANALFLVTLGACTRPASKSPDASAPLAARVDSLADAMFAARLVLEPEFGTEAGLTKGNHGAIRDNTPAGIHAVHARWDAMSR